MSTLIIILFSLFGLLAFGRGLQMWGVQRRLTAARKTLLLPMHTEQGQRSLVDLFWELGASAYALDVLAVRGLLETEPEQLWRARFNEEMALHGGWEGFLTDLRHAQQEAGLEDERVVVPQYYAAARRVLATNNVGTQQAGEPQGAAAPTLIDVDALPGVDWGELFDGILAGEIRSSLKQWLSSRQLSRQRAHMDSALEQLVDLLRSGGWLDNLNYKLSLPQHAWNAEVRRLAALRELRLQDSPEDVSVRSLLGLAMERAEHYAQQSNAFREAILIALERRQDSKADQGLGWQLYRHKGSLLVDLAPEIDAAVQRIDRAVQALGDRVQQLSS